MQFVKTEDIKTGMRLARPMYSKKGVLLYDRDSVISAQAIDSIRNYGLLGIYILEPAEPLPPMSDEDLEFERFQIMTVSSIEDEINKILTTRYQNRAQIIANNIIKKYGHLEDKITFYQNLRSKEDFIYRHSLNVAILSTMMCNALNIKLEERAHTVCAALVHDIGNVNDASAAIYGDAVDGDEISRLYDKQMSGIELIERAFASDGASVRRICAQALKKQRRLYEDDGTKSKIKMTMGAKILLVANRYDELTAMNLNGNAKSEVKAIREFLEYPDIYDSVVVDALIRSINILFPGVSIELNTGEKAMVLVENKADILRPMVLSFKDNSIIDLADKDNSDIQVEDVMKTLDNRYIMDTETLRKAGYL